MFRFGGIFHTLDTTAESYHMMTSEAFREQRCNTAHLSAGPSQQPHAGEWTDSAQLYALVNRLVRQRVGRASTWGCDPDDILHDVFLSVTRAIRAGEIREPERLHAYILGTAYRMCCRSLQKAVVARKNLALDPVLRVTCRAEPCAEAVLSEAQRLRTVEELIRALPQIDQVIVRRFYLDEVEWETIAAELDLTPTQFRLRKNRALSRMRGLAGVNSRVSCN
jgi:RNA polymerase sigma factor (sigma-70 family)